MTPSTAIRRALVAILALSLALTGLAAQPAAAAGKTVSVDGLGSGYSETFELDAGIHHIEFGFVDNAFGTVEAWLVGDSGEQPVAFDVAESGLIERFVLSGGGEFWLEVDVDDEDTYWYADITPAEMPTRVSTSLEASGSGMDTSSLYLLEKGSYAYSAAFTNNSLADGAVPVTIYAADLEAEKIHLLIDEQDGVSGKSSGTFQLAKRSIVWIDSIALPSTRWTVTAKLQPSKKLVSTPTPKISGTAAVGKKLTATPGSWEPAVVNLTYQWLRDGKKISGATSSTYTLKSADKGKKIKVTVTGKKSGYVSVAKTSSPTKAVKAGTLTAKTPKISGSAKVGNKLTAKPGTWKPSGVKFTYQWYRGTTKISGATKSTYKLTTKDKGKKIKVKVTGKKAGFTTVSKTSNPTSAVTYPSRTASNSYGECPSWAPIKGNASSMIYHMKGQRFYTRTIAEECFSTQSAAKAAGYRKAKV